jgi:hypothetical protein
MGPKDMILNAAHIIAEAIKFIEREGWWGENEGCWLALLFDAEGDFLTGGVGRTAAQAAACAWVWTWHPCGDPAWNRVMPELSIRAPSEQPSRVPRFILNDGGKPDDYRLELFPPGTWEGELTRVGRGVVGRFRAKKVLGREGRLFASAAARRLD